MEYIIAGIRIDFPEEFVTGRFGRALAHFATHCNGVAPATAKGPGDNPAGFAQQGPAKEGQTGKRCGAGGRKVDQAHTAQAPEGTDKPLAAIGQRPDGVCTAQGIDDAAKTYTTAVPAQGIDDAAKAYTTAVPAQGIEDAAEVRAATGQRTDKIWAATEHDTDDAPAAMGTEDAAGLKIVIRQSLTEGPGYRQLDAFEFAEADADCRFGCDAQGYLLTITPRNGSAPAHFRTAFGARTAACDMTPEHDPALFRFGVWVLYNIAAVTRQTVAVHSSVICCNGEAVLFLGESGTGKSTHTRLWREHIPGAELLNDDSPIVRIAPRSCIGETESMTSYKATEDITTSADSGKKPENPVAAAPECRETIATAILPGPAKTPENPVAAAPECRETIATAILPDLARTPENPMTAAPECRETIAASTGHGSPTEQQTAAEEAAAKEATATEAAATEAASTQSATALRILACGSPWSGKTPCYRNLCLQIRAIVRLSQAPHNRIRRLRPMEAVGALLPSCPPSFAYDEKLQDALCSLISEVVSHVPVYHLECLPDADAAQLACRTVFGVATLND